MATSHLVPAARISDGCGAAVASPPLLLPVPGSAEQMTQTTPTKQLEAAGAGAGAAELMMSPACLQFKLWQEEGF